MASSFLCPKRNFYYVCKSALNKDLGFTENVPHNNNTNCA